MASSESPVGGEVHIWVSAPLDRRHIAGNIACLDRSERARADGFRRELDHDRFVFAHAFMRRVLGRYVGVSPEKVGIRRSPGGKPRLEPASDLSFSLSHADDLAIVAVVRGREVGVDVERLRFIDDTIGLASTHFTTREAEALRAAPAAARTATFLAMWTRKESVVKALGGGLSIPLDTFEVLPDGSGWVRPRGDGPDAQSFSIASIEVPAGYVGAVTVTGTPIPVRQMGSEPSP